MVWPKGGRGQYQTTPGLEVAVDGRQCERILMLSGRENPENGTTEPYHKDILKDTYLEHGEDLSEHQSAQPGVPGVHAICSNQPPYLAVQQTLYWARHLCGRCDANRRRMMVDCKQGRLASNIALVMLFFSFFFISFWMRKKHADNYNIVK